ncbi:uncharacterized protein DNG_09796 [Cephalotrichum gorgonifer]|uniref:NACHT-NTPase and P-loop NTPases N-terminal domain-containing protein n=1 Tax=Cephalotrichum gorgonifer TaxID=2041049 RepID=A0AAE8N6I2_9PEZI|nr:uncharacterized protein DNG_09796 [Cephalotrichum gorgonifer]
MTATKLAQAAEEAKEGLDEAIGNVDLAIYDSKDVGEVKYLPKALYGVQRHLPTAKDLLARMMDSLDESESEGAVQRDSAFYLRVKTAAENVAAQAESISTLYSQTLSGEDEEEPPTERYRRAVGPGGEKLETVMVGLLRNIFNVARKFPLGKEDIESLTKALSEVKRLPVSFYEDGGGGAMHNVNNGPGVMPIHNGTGAINTTTGSGVNLPGGTITNFNGMPQAGGS